MFDRRKIKTIISEELYIILHEYKTNFSCSMGNFVNDILTGFFADIPENIIVKVPRKQNSVHFHVEISEENYSKLVDLHLFVRLSQSTIVCCAIEQYLEKEII